MLTSINLLSKERKTELLRFFRTRSIFYYGALFLSIPIVAIVMLIIFIIIANFDRDIVVSELDNIKNHHNFENVQDQDIAIDRINGLTHEIKSMSEHQNRYSGIFNSVASNIEDGVSIVSIFIDDNVIVIKGKAFDRIGVLSLVDNLKSAECLADVTVPLTGLVKRNDTEFILSATIIKNCL